MFYEGKVFAGKIWGEGGKECDLLLIGSWWGNRVVPQEFCAQSEVIILHMGGALVLAKKKKSNWDILM